MGEGENIYKIFPKNAMPTHHPSEMFTKELSEGLITH